MKKTKSNYSFRTLVTVIIATLSMQLAATSPAQAQSCTPVASLGNGTAAENLSNFAEALASNGETQNQINNTIAADLCVTPITPNVSLGISPLAASVNSDMTLSPASIYLDTATNQYLSLTGWSWDNTNYSGEISGLPTSPVNIGSTDGFGTSVSGGVTVYSSSLSYGGAGCYFAATTTSSPSSSSSIGQAYKFQDKYVVGSQGKCNNSKTGQMSMMINNPTSCKTVQIFSAYGHTWSSTTITGITLGSSSVGISFSTTANSWRLASNPNPSFNIC